MNCDSSNAPPRPSSTIVDGKVPLRAAVVDMASLFRRRIEETPRKRKQQAEKTNPLRINKTTAEPSMESLPHITKSTMPLICMEVADLFNMDTPDEEIDSFMERALNDEDDDDKIDNSYLCRNVNAEDTSSHSLQVSSTHHQAATSSSVGTYNKDIDAAVESQEAKLVATMTKTAASRAALKQFGVQSSRQADHSQSAMTSSNATYAATKNLLSRNTRCSSEVNEMRAPKRLKAATCTQNEARYDSIIAAACLILGGGPRKE